MTKEEYQADKERRAKLTEDALKATEQSQPTPTQEENDLLRLGLMHPDHKASPDNPGGGPPRARAAASAPATETKKS